LAANVFSRGSHNGDDWARVRLKPSKTRTPNRSNTKLANTKLVRGMRPAFV